MPTQLPLLLLSVLLGLAVWHDLRARRIPNAIVFPGALAGLALHALLPAGSGLFGTPMGSLGILSALGGLALGLAILLPMYVFRLMGAGDVKLLAMVGAFAGHGDILAVGIAALLAGGVLALAVAAAQGILGRVLNNTWQTLLHAGLTHMRDGMALPDPSGRLPYAVAIAAGTAACVAWLRVFGELPL
ncbi:prepilin peptidase [Massilia sp. METH4]|uniref:prepilin peptidase n=1 Tax=Massilia sp. METH4 TaxID=3123041 RepID=UPI0030CB980D